MWTTFRLRAARPMVGMTTLRPWVAQEEFAVGSQRIVSVIICVQPVKKTVSSAEARATAVGVPWR